MLFCRLNDDGDDDDDGDDGDGDDSNIEIIGPTNSAIRNGRMPFYPLLVVLPTHQLSTSLHFLHLCTYFV